MATITQEQLENRLGADELVRLTDDAGARSVDADVLDRHIEEGESEILNNIGQRYQLPLASTNAATTAAVRTKLIDAVVYRLYMHRDHRVDESIETAYRDAVKWSESIAAGRLGLIGELLLDSSPAAGGTMLIVGDDATIDRDTMAGL
jgi:phage gp36-like protein